MMKRSCISFVTWNHIKIFILIYAYYSFIFRILYLWICLTFIFSLYSSFMLILSRSFQYTCFQFGILHMSPHEFTYYVSISIKIEELACILSSCLVDVEKLSDHSLERPQCMQSIGHTQLQFIIVFQTPS